jgi:putative phosphoesterase
MKIIVFSDSHGDKANMETAILREGPDMLIFLGDGIADFKVLLKAFPGIEAYGVKGNCDLRSNERERLIIGAEDKKILMMHGHQYNVKLGMERFFFAALEAQADIALFGHTHSPYNKEVRGIKILNPGSIGRGLKPSYGLIIIKDGVVKTEIVSLV